jgi:hypothetical protein
MRRCIGQVVEVNTALKDKPEAVNSNPHDTWLVILKVGNPAEMDGLLDAAVRRPRQVGALRVPAHRTGSRRRGAMLEIVGAPSLDARRQAFTGYPAAASVICGRPQRRGICPARRYARSFACQ